MSWNPLDGFTSYGGSGYGQQLGGFGGYGNMLRGFGGLSGRRGYGQRSSDYGSAQDMMHAGGMNGRSGNSYGGLNDDRDMGYNQSSTAEHYGGQAHHQNAPGARYGDLQYRSDDGDSALARIDAEWTAKAIREGRYRGGQFRGCGGGF